MLAQDDLFGSIRLPPRSKFDPKEAMSKNESAFWEFHKQHPEFAVAFNKYAYELINAGREYGSAYLICERIRWDTMLSGADVDGFKINNNHRPYYARQWMMRNPHNEGFFRTREIRN